MADKRKDKNAARSDKNAPRSDKNSQHSSDDNDEDGQGRRHLRKGPVPGSGSKHRKDRERGKGEDEIKERKKKPDENKSDAREESLERGEDRREGRPSRERRGENRERRESRDRSDSRERNDFQERDGIKERRDSRERKDSHKSHGGSRKDHSQHKKVSSKGRSDSHERRPRSNSPGRKPSERRESRDPSRHKDRRSSRESSSEKNPCHDGPDCSLWSVDATHAAKYSHSPKCKSGASCQRHLDASHMQRYFHPFQRPCRYGSLCRDAKDRRHCANYAHPCKYAGECRDLAEGRAEHCRQYTHLLACRFARDCREQDDPSHTAQVSHFGTGDKELRRKRSPQSERRRTRHISPSDSESSPPRSGSRSSRSHTPPTACRDGALCTKWVLDKSHLREYQHPPQCRDGYRCAESHRREHLQQFLHPFLVPCSEGQLCPSVGKPDHSFSHPCRFGNMCNLLKSRDLKHCQLFVHLPPCKHGDQCHHISDTAHLAKYSHPHQAARVCRYGAFCVAVNDEDHMKQYLHPPLRNATCDIRGCNSGVDFSRNHAMMLADTNKWAGGKVNVRDDVRAWVRSLRPCHRLDATKLDSVTKIGGVVSLAFLQHFAKDFAHGCLTSFKSMPDAAKILAKHKLEFKVIAGWCKAYLVVAYGRTQQQVAEEAQRKLKQERAALESKNLSSSDFEVLEKVGDLLVQRSIEMSNNGVGGIGYKVDVEMGTNKQIFSIVGPHSNNQGGTDYGSILLIFSQELMHHPDFSVSAVAATGYHNRSTKVLRPWDTTKDDVPAPQWFATRKMHPAGKDWDIAMAAELQCMAKVHFDADDLEAVKLMYYTKNTHFLMEGHLPGFVPLMGYVEKIVINEATFEVLSAECKQRLKQLPLRNLVRSAPGKENVLLVCLAKDWVVYKPPTAFVGFCVSLDQLFGRTRSLPVAAHTPDDLRLTFEARGSVVEVLLADTAKPYGRRSRETGNFYSVVYEPRRGIALKKRDQLLGSSKNFPKDSAHFVQFMVEYSGGTIRVQAGIRNKLRMAVVLEVRDREPLKKVRFLHLSCGSDQATFRNVLFYSP